MTEPFQAQNLSAKRKIPGWFLALGVSLLVSVAIVLPFFWMGSASGHDFEFHTASWLDVSYQWSEGTFYPRWTAWTNHGFGEPRFIFYPPLSWMLGAALARALPLPWVPLGFVLITQTLAGMCAYFLLRRLTSEKAALLAAACYVANPNALLMTYIRSDYAEQLACAIFPLLFLGALKLANLLRDEQGKRPSILAFTIPFALVWLCNAPAGVIASYFAALLFGWAALTQRSWKITWRASSALALGFGLIGFYLLPAAYEQRWVNIAQILSSGLLPYQNFLFTSIRDVDHNWFNVIASWCAVVLMLELTISALASRRFADGPTTGERKRGLWSALLLLGTAASLSMLPFTNLLWMHLPKLRFIQFPWRVMSVVALVYVCFLGVVIEKRRGWLAAAMIFVLAVPMAIFLINNGWWDPDEMDDQQTTIVDKIGFDGTDEYDPAGDDHLNLPAKVPEVRVVEDGEEGGDAGAVTVKILKWNTERREILVDASEDSQLAMRVLNYPAWRVEVNGKPVVPDRMDNNNEMVIPVEQGKSVIRIWFARTADRTIGGILSFISLLVACILFVWERSRDGRN